MLFRGESMLLSDGADDDSMLLSDGAGDHSQLLSDDADSDAVEWPCLFLAHLLNFLPIACIVF